MRYSTLWQLCFSQTYQSIYPEHFLILARVKTKALERQLKLIAIKYQPSYLHLHYLKKNNLMRPLYLVLKGPQLMQSNLLRCKDSFPPSELTWLTRDQIW